MLKQLTIKNLAIIDDITLDFEENLNVLTGETGAGKSIIIDAIDLIFGARASSEIIAHGKENAFISAALELDNNKCKYILDNFDIDVSEEFIITRTLSINNKNTTKINGSIVPLHVVNELSSFLIDISSQNESQFLFNNKNHLKLLDSFIENIIPNFKNDYSKTYIEYLEILNKYNVLNKKQIDAGELEFLQFKYQELKDYKYSLEDEQNIQNEYKYLKSCSQNIELFEDIINELDNDNNGVNAKFYQAIRKLSKLTSNEKVNRYYEKFNSLYLDTYDLVEEFKKDFSNDSIDLSQIDYLSNEITKINRLKRKYNVNDLLLYKQKLEEDIENIINREMLLSSLLKQLNTKKTELLNEADKISKIRKQHSLKLAKLVKSELDDLYLTDASFSINFNILDEPNKDGIDFVEFYMSANKGVPEKPLIKVASGGEVSRIMLGLKAVFTNLALIDVIIFDEIDTGVSGKVALAMGKKMAKIAKSAQVLAITHLPQVAAMSDHHFYIYKKSNENTTKTIVNKLNNEQKEHEVARLLSGDDVSSSFIIAAKELISSK